MSSTSRSFLDNSCTADHCIPLRDALGAGVFDPTDSAQILLQLTLSSLRMPAVTISHPVPSDTLGCPPWQTEQANTPAGFITAVDVRGGASQG